jgi:hypothetical protein
MSSTDLSLFYGAGEFYMRWKLHRAISQNPVCPRAWVSGSWQVRMAVERVQFRGDIKNHKNIGCYTLSIRNKLHGKWILCAHKLLSSSPISFQGLEHFLFRDQPPNTYAADSKLFLHPYNNVYSGIRPRVVRWRCSSHQILYSFPFYSVENTSNFFLSDSSSYPSITVHPLTNRKNISTARNVISSFFPEKWNSNAATVNILRAIK